MGLRVSRPELLARSARRRVRIVSWIRFDRLGAENLGLSSLWTEIGRTSTEGEPIIARQAKRSCSHPSSGSSGPPEDRLQSY